MRVFKGGSKIFRRVFLYVMLTGFLVLSVVLAFMLSVMTALYDSQMRESLVNSAELIAQGAGRGEFPDMAAFRGLCDEFSKNSTIRISIISPEGKMLLDSGGDEGQMENHAGRPEVSEAVKTLEPAVSKRFSKTLGAHMMYVCVPERDKSGRLHYLIRLAMPLDRIEKVKENFLYIALGLYALALAIAGAAAYRIARGVSVPVEALREGALEYSKGNFDHRLPSSDIPELDLLGRGMQSMALRLKDEISKLSFRTEILSETFAAMRECVFVCSSDGSIIFINGAAERMFGAGPGSASGRRIGELVRDSRLMALIDETFASGRCSAQAELSVQGGMDIDFTGTVLDGHERRAIFVLHDISDIKRLERMRKNFVAGVSHELKTPITSVKGFVETLREMESDSDKLRFFGIIEKEADRMNSIIDDMLLLSRMEIDPERERKYFSEVRICQVLQEAAGMHEARAAERGISFELSCDPDLVASAHAALLVTAVANLVGNAAKYALENTSVKISAKRDGGWIVISVADEGPGISPEHASMVFERFYRIDKGRSRSMGGTGLGLAIVKHVAIMHGGAAWLAQAPGGGSVFCIKISGARSASQPE